MRSLAVRNGLWNAGANVVGIATGIAGTLLIPRTLTTEEYGLFSYYIWLAGILNLVGTLAFPGALTKIVSELRGKGQTQAAQALSIGVSLMLFGINILLSAGAMLWSLRVPEQHQIFLFIIACAIIPKALTSSLRSSLMGAERYRPVSITLMGGSLIQITLIVLAFFQDWGAPGFVAAMLIGEAIQFLVLLVVFWQPAASSEPKPSFKPGLLDRATIRHYGAFVIPSTLTMITTQIVWERSEILFLQWSDSGMEQIGFYSLAYTIFFMFFTLGGALLNPIQPSISYDYGAGNWSSIESKVHQGVIIATLYAVPLALGGWATLDQLVPLLVTAKMQPVADVAQILFIGLLPACFGITLGLMLNAAGGVWSHVRLGIIMSVLNIVLDIFLIPYWQSLGGAIANTVSQVCYIALLFIVVRRLYAISMPWRSIGTIVGIGLLTTLLVPWGVQLWLPGVWGLFLAIGLGGGLYLTSVWRLGYLKLFFAQAPTLQ